jgi:hypothetical protein
VGANASYCSDGYSCTSSHGNPTPPFTVCFQNAAGTECEDYCWGYSGSEAGILYTCACPNVNAGTWK